MAANIKTTLNGDAVTELLGSSRDDLAKGDVVTCVSADAALTDAGYAWSLAYVPSDDGGASEAELLVDGNSCEFTIDKEGPYLLKLVVDAGTEHEDEQYLRLRALTATAGLRLIAAGEQISDEVAIPSDLSGYGWAEDQNKNLRGLANAIGGLSDVVSELDGVVEANRVAAEEDNTDLGADLVGKISTLSDDVEANKNISDQQFEAFDLKVSMLKVADAAFELEIDSNKTANDEAIAALQAQVVALTEALALVGDGSFNQKYLHRTPVVDLEYLCHDCDVYLAVKTQEGMDTVIHLEPEAAEHRRLYIVDETALGRALVRPGVVDGVPAKIDGSEEDLVLENGAGVHLSCGGTTEDGVKEWFSC